MILCDREVEAALEAGPELSLIAPPRSSGFQASSLDLCVWTIFSTSGNSRNTKKDWSRNRIGFVAGSTFVYNFTQNEKQYTRSISISNGSTTFCIRCANPPRMRSRHFIG